jgi:hypothetical protein
MIKPIFGNPLDRHASLAMTEEILGMTEKKVAMTNP